MKNKSKRPRAYHRLRKEIGDIGPKRVDLLTELQKEEKFKDKKIITFFTSFKYPVAIEDADAIMIEEVLINTDFSNKGLLFVLNSPGGSGLAAERIINICRNYSSNDFEVLVPNKAKSAATMICLGSNKIWMSSSSELGPIDPQTIMKVEDKNAMIGMEYLIKNFDSIFRKACKCKERIEPFLQQLERFDSRVIEIYKSEVALSSDIAVKALKMGMMSSLNKTQIKRKIEPFLKPIKTRVHGRPIFIEQAKKCRLNAEEIDISSKLWHKIWDLFLRTEYVVNDKAAKIVESDEEMYYISAPQ